MRQEELERVWRGLSAANLPEGSRGNISVFTLY